MNEVTWCPGMTLEHIEKLIIKKAYSIYQGNKTMTARSLGVAIRTLDNKFEKYKKDDEDDQTSVADNRSIRAELLRKARGDSHLHRKASSWSDVPSADTGKRMEPVAVASKEYEVSLPESEKVQGVLPPQVTDLREKRSRISVS